MALKTQTSSTGQKHAKGGGGGGGGGRAYMAKGHKEDWLDPNRRLTTTSL